MLASAIRGIGWWAAPYVIFVHVAGGTILLNLLLAILIESFEENTQREQLLSGELRQKFISAGERARRLARSFENKLEGQGAKPCPAFSPKSNALRIGTESAL